MDNTKIIVVEDNIVYCEFVCNLLARKGFRTVQAFHLSTAKKLLLQATENDIIVSDLRLPEGDGIDLPDGEPGLSECRVDHRDEVLLVRPRSQFGDHAAVFYVHGLGGDHVRQQQVVADHGSRRIVARGFDAENCNIHPVFRFF